MKVIFPYKFEHRFIPKGCRKERKETRKSEIEVEIREVPESEAPVALVGHYNEGSKTRQPYTVVYRWFDEQFWADRHTSGYNIEGNRYVFEQPHAGSDWTSESEESCLERARKWAREQIIVGGQFFAPVGEPVYHVEYHWGYRYDYVEFDVQHKDELNDSGEGYYRIDELDRATEFALSVRKNEAVKDDPPVPKARFEILMPETVQFNSRKFYSSKFVFLMVTERPIKDFTPEELFEEFRKEKGRGKFKRSHEKIISPLQAAKYAIENGGDPTIFDLDRRGSNVPKEPSEAEIAAEVSRPCDALCLQHAPSCDGSCTHFPGHVNGCWPDPHTFSKTIQEAESETVTEHVYIEPVRQMPVKTAAGIFIEPEPPRPGEQRGLYD